MVRTWCCALVVLCLTASPVQGKVLYSTYEPGQTPVDYDASKPYSIYSEITYNPYFDVPVVEGVSQDVPTPLSGNGRQWVTFSFVADASGIPGAVYMPLKQSTTAIGDTSSVAVRVDVIPRDGTVGWAFYADFDEISDTSIEDGLLERTGVTSNTLVAGQTYDVEVKMAGHSGVWTYGSYVPDNRTSLHHEEDNLAAEVTTPLDAMPAFMLVDAAGVPEPASVALLTLGGLLIVRRR